LNIEKRVNSSAVECDRAKQSRLGDIKSGDIGIILSVRSSRDRGCSRKNGTIALTGKMIISMETKRIWRLNLLKSNV